MMLIAEDVCDIHYLRQTILIWKQEDTPYQLLPRTSTQRGTQPHHLRDRTAFVSPGGTWQSTRRHLHLQSEK